MQRSENNKRGYQEGREGDGSIEGAEEREDERGRERSDGGVWNNRRGDVGERARERESMEGAGREEDDSLPEAFYNRPF
jgi:hypothetical protein